jgi:hypothetical protein
MSTDAKEPIDPELRAAIERATEEHEAAIRLALKVHPEGLTGDELEGRVEEILEVAREPIEVSDAD